MKKGKIILSIIAALVTIGGSLSFKIANKFNGTPRLFAWTSVSGKGCATCKSVWATTTSSYGHLSTCNTIGLQILFARNGRTFFTAKTTNGRFCKTWAPSARTRVTRLN